MNIHPVIRQRVIPAVAATGVIAILAAGGWYGYGAVANRPVRNVAFSGDVAMLPADVLEEFSRELRKRTVGTSLASVRENAKRIPWVRDAAVRRQFPDTIEVRFQAHRALARWNEKDLVSPEGEVFSATTDAALPSFHGPDAAAGMLAAAYPALVEALAPVGSAITDLRLSPRGAWEATLASGLRIELGREDLLVRARRFAAAWPQLAANGVDTKYADLRYSNGFALRQAAATPSPALPQGGGKKTKKK